ncbi:hypothetical protein GUJ93_ZPchr0008g12861 [Zizania palustris]|uniref:Uncharacterized protein n=1 Tax=Zizania palustris TaxID=103762 RepID=A0A8J5V1D8_ZIZPA|nr:hypothetical protein GUJ93_ZPchr0008g12861 [Zizania palustris]
MTKLRRNGYGQPLAAGKVFGIRQRKMGTVALRQLSHKAYPKEMGIHHRSMDKEAENKGEGKAGDGISRKPPRERDGWKRTCRSRLRWRRGGLRQVVLVSTRT